MREGVQAGTGQWFLQHDKFLGWANGDSRVMWCPGIRRSFRCSDCLKMRLLMNRSSWGRKDKDHVWVTPVLILTCFTDTCSRSLVVEHLEGHEAVPDLGLAYIYCDFSQREAQTPLRLLSSIAEQLLRRRDRDMLPPEVLSLYNLHKKHGTRPTLTHITEVLAHVCSQLTVVRIVIDALDECSYSEEATLELISAVLDMGSNVRLLCTSRASLLLGSYFQDLDAAILQIRPKATTSARSLKPTSHASRDLHDMFDPTRRLKKILFRLL